tara:strand:- start:1074 stop:1529 length:456 start_codon:yes stop_codon:yes gene_type:complete
MAVEPLMGNPSAAPMSGEQPEAPMQGGGQPQPVNINAQEFQNAMQNLSPPAMQALDMHLTPAVKQALAELLGPEVSEVIQDIGPDQPTVSLPLSVIASAYPADDIQQSIQMMEEDFKSKAGPSPQEIPGPPEGGLGGAPTGAPPTNVPPMQ